MKTDLYTKSVLTIIAVCLIVLIFKNNDIVPTAKAVPAISGQIGNEVVDVRIVDVSYNTEIPVKIESVKSAIPVRGEGNFGRGSIPVTIENISYGINNAMPVKVKN